MTDQDKQAIRCGVGIVAGGLIGAGYIAGMVWIIFAMGG